MHGGLVGLLELTVKSVKLQNGVTVLRWRVTGSEYLNQLFIEYS